MQQRPTVPINKLQSGLLEHGRRLGQPGSGELHFSVGLLLNVYDRERIDLGDIPEEVSKRLKTAPGLLWSEVRLLGNSRQLFLPFEEAEDQIYLTYGNGALLEGRRVKIMFMNNDINSGRIILDRSLGEQVVNLSTATEILDIGALV